MNGIVRTCGFVFCLAAAGLVAADDWPQWRGVERDGVWRETGIVKELPKKLSFLWRAPVGMGYAGPAVAAGRVYLMDRVLGSGEENPDNPFDKKRVNGSERILCFDAVSGKVLWKHSYPSNYTISYPYGPRTTPTVSGGKVYCLGAMGDLLCLDAGSGKVLWSKQCVKDFGAELNTWGYSSPPLVDGEKLIVLVGGKPGACYVALNKDTGKELWRSLEDTDPGYAPPVIYKAGGVRQLITWTPTKLAALDPETGKEYWRQEFKVNFGLTIPTPIYDPESKRLLVSSFYNGSLMMTLDSSKPAARLLWKGKSDSELPKRTDGLHSIMCTPVFEGGHIFGVGSYGELRCLEAATGQRVWKTMKATGQGRWWNAFITRHEDRYFIFNEQGELIIANLSSKGYEELSRAQLIEGTRRVQRRKVVWSHPAFAQKCVFVRNDKEIVCVSLADSAGK
ncbi:MAG: PQQ-binding-like beta-propeller repeat protein [Planctomycetota bacterium]|nr:PQQ-binding-like beta-propeller repeat protein [Planctomycetota bacterium]